MREDEIRDVTPGWEDNEPAEVVGWYIPGGKEVREVVSCYVQDRPLPGRAGISVPPQEGEQTKRSRKGLWIFLGSLVILVAIVMGIGFMTGVFGGTGQDKVSSIVEIFREERISVPRYTGKSELRLVCKNPTGPELSAREVYEKANPSVVTIVTQMGSGRGIGTGVIISEDGFILTNAHVLAEAENCWILMSNEWTYEALLVGYDKQQDLAVLKAVGAEGLPAAEIGNSDLARVGDPVYAIGTPLGLELYNTLTNGIISAVDRVVEIGGNEISAIQTNAAINHGNSGGPLINAYGQVIGINTLKMPTREGMDAIVEGLGFAISISDASFVINDLIEKGRYEGTPTLGISVLTVKAEDGSSYVMVYTVDKGLGAEKAGLQKGDVILQVNGMDIFTTEDLMAVRRDCRVGDTMDMTILRQGEKLQISVLLQAVK